MVHCTPVAAKWPNDMGFLRSLIALGPRAWEPPTSLAQLVALACGYRVSTAETGASATASDRLPIAQENSAVTVSE